METHFTIDTRGNNMSWFLIDTETTLANKIRHSACVSLHTNLGYTHTHTYIIRFYI